MKKYIVYVTGATCASCQLFIETTVGSVSSLSQVSCNIKTGEVTFFGENIDERELIDILNEKMKEKRYRFSLEKKEEEKLDRGDILKALPIGILFLAIFFILQKSGILNFGIGGVITPVTGFLIGLVASVSSCLAIVGGLVLSLSAKVARDDKTNKKPILLFHTGRLVGFAILGGVLGLLGKEVGINFLFSSILGVIASIIMLALGLNLVGIFKKSKFTLPSGIFSFFRKVEHETFTPIFIGVGTFFLPCGFTQSMQVSAFSSGGFFSGLSIMLSFALGTLPMLALLSFTSVSFARSKYSSLFFMSVGIIVIGFGVFSLLSGLAGLGIINPLFNI